MPVTPKTSAAHVAWVVPCFDEAARIDGPALLALVEACTPASLILVDDGSRDQTGERLREIAAARPDQVEVITLPENKGKGEAVRQGLLRALSRGAEQGAEILAYVDADLSTPPSELCRLAALARSGAYDVLMGSRVQLLGHAIEPGSKLRTTAALRSGLDLFRLGLRLRRP